MNVLILTPDAVGSTLLQRLITIYMQFHSFDKPVINLHELTNGLVKYHNTKLDMEVLGKSDNKTAWGYHQSLEEIVNLLNSTNHYKTSRLSQYHIKNRQDSLEFQVPFYRYLNENFFIIACRRHNVFEHAISWAITKVTKKLNVYSPDEKINSFFHLYKDRLTIDPETLIQTLNAYKDYLKWCDDHFSVASYFYYDQHLPNIEKYILDLPIFAKQVQKISWNDKYNIELNDWNKCHYLSSDIGSLVLTHQAEFQQLLSTTTGSTVDVLTPFIKSYHNIADPSWPEIESFTDFNNLPDTIKNECKDLHGLELPKDQSNTIANNLNLTLPVEHTRFLTKNSQNYNLATQSISSMVNDGMMISPPPIKKQTMLEKQFLIKNFEQCLDVYNNWILNNPLVGNPINTSIIDQFAQIEMGYWSPESTGPTVNPVAALSDQPDAD
jgi:hypothetical protein